MQLATIVARVALVCSLTACVDAEVTELDRDPVPEKPSGPPDATEICRKTSGRVVPTTPSGLDNVPRIPFDDDAVAAPCLLDDDEPDGSGR